MTKFANLADAGARLALLVAEQMSDATSPIVLAAIPNGVPVAIPVAAALGVHARALPVLRTDDGPVIGALPDLRARVVIVIDDGVETGSVARAAATAIRLQEPAELVLAVPVCSREAMSFLQMAYDRIIAVDTPFGRRALNWHFEDFDTIDEERALDLLAAQH